MMLVGIIGKQVENILMTSLTHFRVTHEIEIFKSSLHIREFYPEKNAHESKIKRDYGNKAYQECKDLDALYLYTQVYSSHFLKR